MALKKKQLKDELDKLKIKYPKNLGLPGLQKLYNEAKPKQTPPKEVSKEKIKNPPKEKSKDLPKETNKETEEVEARPRQASLVECMRQAAGQKPFGGSALGKE